MGTLERTSEDAWRVRIDASHRHGAVSVEVTGALDAASVQRLRRTVESLAAAGDDVRIDVEGVEPIAFAELGALLRMHQRGVGRGWNLTWIGLPRLVLDTSERFGIPGAIAALMVVSLRSASQNGWDASQEVLDAT